MDPSLGSPDSLDTSRIKDWRSIISLICFVLANGFVLFPLSIPIPVPRRLWVMWLTVVVKARIMPQSRMPDLEGKGSYKRLHFPINFVTAPLIAVLFLLAILAIGREEVRGGTLGADHIAPINIMIFFLSLAYIAISIDGTGLIRWLSCKVLQKGGDSGRLLFLYLYLFFFALATCVGNDPVVLSGTPFLAYLTRASSNISTPRAWIFTQFAVANVASAILVSSNPTNLVLAGAFQIRFVDYTVNMIVPVIVTAVLLLPFLLWIVFPGQQYIPSKIELHRLPEGRSNRTSLNPNLPRPTPKAGLTAEQEQEQFLDSLEEVLNPYLDRNSAIFSSCVMAAVLIAVLVLNAAAPAGKEYPVFWITLPAAVIVFAWDMCVGWASRHEHREIVRWRRAQAEASPESQEKSGGSSDEHVVPASHVGAESGAASTDIEEKETAHSRAIVGHRQPMHTEPKHGDGNGNRANNLTAVPGLIVQEPATLQSVAHATFIWLEETFPTPLRTLSALPLPLVPFAFCMFVLVQALVTKGWIPVFAIGWDRWVSKTGVVGAVGGMAFLSVILCNFAGTNIGTTILLCRMIQAWLQIHEQSDEAIPQRTFWATVYSMALGVNYGAFSIAISGALAGMLWQNILDHKGIVVGGMEFYKVNQPFILFTMVIGCAVLIGEVYLTRGTGPYVQRGD